MNKKKKNHKNILIFRPDNLGDLVLFSGALKHISNYFQNATVSMCIREYTHDYFKHCPYIENLYSWEKYCVPSSKVVTKIPGRRYLLGWFDKLYRKHLLKELDADFIIVPTRSPRKGIYGEYAVISDISASIKIGITGDLTNQDAQNNVLSKKLYTKYLELEEDSQYLHELDVTAQFLHFLGINVETTELWPDIWTTKEDRIWAEQIIPQSDTSTILALCPGASTTKKMYPIHHYKAVFDSFNSGNFTVILFGSQSERNLCERIEAEIQNCERVVRVSNLAGNSTITQLVEGLNRCDIILSVDSASLHLGVALRKPVVAIMGGGHYGRFYPWGDPSLHRVVNKPMDCYQCNWHCKFPSIRCIEEIDPMKIAFELQSLIKKI